MYRHVLVPLDGSTFAEAALSWAVPIVRRCGATLHLLLAHEEIARYAVEIAPARLIDQWEDRHRGREARYLDQRALALRAAGLTVEGELLEGQPAETVIRRTAVGVDLMVMSTRGRGGEHRHWPGSVADRLMRQVAVPVLLVPPAAGGIGWPDSAAAGGDPPEGWESAPTHVVVATDGSSAAGAAVDHAAELARLFDARLTVVRAVTPTGRGGAGGGTADRDAALERREAEARDFLTRLTSSLDLPAARRVVRASHAARGILSVCGELGGDVLAVGTHPRSRFARAALGSVTDAVIRGATVPVLLARPGAAGHTGRTRPS
jgi:nucleotide-binding universal stress UspA family protein